MKYCVYCKLPLHDGYQNCPQCGRAAAVSKAGNNGDDSSLLLALMSFFIPVIGLILWFVWMERYPWCAASCGKGTVWGVSVYFLLLILFVFIRGCVTPG